MSLSDDGVEHLDDETLFGAGETSDLFHLSLKLGCGAASLSALRLFPLNEVIDGDAEDLGELGERGDGNAAAAFLEGVACSLTWVRSCASTAAEPMRRKPSLP